MEQSICGSSSEPLWTRLKCLSFLAPYKSLSSPYKSLPLNCSPTQSQLQVYSWSKFKISLWLFFFFFMSRKCVSPLILITCSIEIIANSSKLLRSEDWPLNSTHVIDFQRNVTDPASYADSIRILCLRHASAYFKMLSVTVSVHSDPSRQPELIKTSMCLAGYKFSAWVTSWKTNTRLLWSL